VSLQQNNTFGVATKLKLHGHTMALGEPGCVRIAPARGLERGSQPYLFGFASSPGSLDVRRARAESQPPSVADTWRASGAERTSAQHLGARRDA